MATPIVAQVQFPEKIERLETDQPLIDCQQFQGSYWQVDSTINRDSIAIAKRERGMAVASREIGNYIIRIYNGPDTTTTEWVKKTNWDKIADSTDVANATPDSAVWATRNYVRDTISSYQLLSDTSIYDATRYWTQYQINDSIAKYWRKNDDTTQYSVYDRVSIGATTYTGPSKLGVTGNMYLTGKLNYNNRGGVSGNTNGLRIIGVATKPIIFYNVDTMRAILTSSGRFGIGDSIPDSRLDVNGLTKTDSLGVDGSYLNLSALPTTSGKDTILVRNNGLAQWMKFTQAKDSSYGRILIKRYNKADTTIKASLIDSISSARMFPLSDSCYVNFSAGRYNPTVNLARDGFKYNFEAGSYVVKTTAGYLFDYSAITTYKPVYITGTGKFDCTYGFLYNSSGTYKKDYYLDNLTITVTNAYAISIAIAGLYTDNTKILCSGGYTNYLPDISDNCIIRNYKYSTNSTGTIYFGNIDVGSTILEGWYVNSSSGPTIDARFYYQSAWMSINANVYGATTALFLYANNINCGINMNGHILGNVSIGINTQFNFNGVCQYSNWTIGVGAVASVNLAGQGLHPATRICTFTNNGGYLYLSGIVATNSGTVIYSNNTAARTFCSATIVNDANQGGYIPINVNSGIVTFTGQIHILNCFNGASYVTITGGKLIFDGDYYYENAGGYITHAITLSGGTLELGSNARITQNAAYSCVRVSGNATLIAKGGVLYTAGQPSITVDNTKTLTIKNYNNYFTNYARGGLGTYTETITGGGTEIVDTDVE